MAQFKYDEIEKEGFYWVKRSGRRSTVVEVRSIPIQNGNTMAHMLHVQAPGAMHFAPLEHFDNATFNGPITRPKGF
jgi:hypothetical protein